MRKARKTIIGKNPPIRAETTSVVWAGRQPPTPAHTWVRQCHQCGRTVYTRPDTQIDAASVARKTIYICDRCCPTYEEAIAYAGQFLSKPMEDE